MKTYTSEEKISIFSEALCELGLCSDIVKRFNQNYWFLVYQDTEEDWEKVVNYIKQKYPNIEDVWQFESNNNSYPLTFMDWITDEHYGNSDEYSICEDCRCAVHNDYSYYREFTIIEDEYEGVIVICDKCLRADEERAKTYIRNHINKTNMWINMFTVEQMEQKGWIKGKEYINGTPEEILKNAQLNEPNKDFIFVRTDEDMFNYQYVIMSKEKENE